MNIFLFPKLSDFISYTVVAARLGWRSFSSDGCIWISRKLRNLPVCRQAGRMRLPKSPNLGIYKKAMDLTIYFLGYIVRPDYLLVRRRVVNRLKGRLMQYQKRLKKEKDNYRVLIYDPTVLEKVMNSWAS